ncbi:MAG: DedA family protein, partial [bacterium]|nr:DedA family protein [bacterium]
MQTVVSFGYPGVMLAAFLENFFPPIPSEAIFPFVGFVASQGGIELLPAVLAGALGAVLGAFFWYGLGALLGRANLKLYLDRYGKYLRIRFSDIEKAERWFDKHASSVVFFGRLIPLVRTFISVPAGFAGMNLLQFTFYSLAGSLLWIGALTGAGFL